MQTRPLKAILMLLIAVITAMPIVAQNSDHNHIVTLHRQPLTEGNIELDPEGRRLPGRPVTCIITENSIECAGVNMEDIVSFEIMDSHGEIIGAFSSQDSFLSTLFNLTGEYGIIFKTENIMFCGYILM